MVMLWSVVNTVILLIVVGCTVGISLLVLVVCISSKRRIMSIRNEVVPVISQSIGGRQKRFVLDEHSLEATFVMRPHHKPSAPLHGWFDVNAAAADDDVASRLVSLYEEEKTLLDSKKKTVVKTGLLPSSSLTASSAAAVVVNVNSKAEVMKVDKTVVPNDEEKNDLATAGDNDNSNNNSNNDGGNNSNNNNNNSNNNDNNSPLSVASTSTKISPIKKPPSPSAATEVSPSSGVEPHVVVSRFSRHHHELHLASLVHHSAPLLEYHAESASQALSRRHSRDVQHDCHAWIRHVQQALMLDKRTCDRWSGLYQRYVWGGPNARARQWWEQQQMQMQRQSAQTPQQRQEQQRKDKFNWDRDDPEMNDMLELCIHVNEICKQIDSTTV